uniref:Actin-related protein 5 n=2 Tax=Mesocestoides corti TaxID=53468 RepID=A0A5K3F2W9_MESCO
MVAHAIVIDNGSFECRAGFSNKKEPSMQFRNVVMKSRSRMRETFVGSVDDDMDVNQVNTKSAFEQNLVTQLDVQEIVFDHIFSKLGVQSNGIDHPVIMSEALCCPQQCRSQVTELLYETYSVNKLSFFVDGLASFYWNFDHAFEGSHFDTVMVSFGYHTTHIIPFSGEPVPMYIPGACRRLSVGGAHVSWYLQQLLALKYPCHAEKITTLIAEDLIHNYGRVCENYREEMCRWKDEVYRLDNTHTWNMPYSDETQLKARELVERRQFQADRLREFHRKRALERVKDEQFDSDESDAQSIHGDVKRDIGDSGRDTIASPSLCDGETSEESLLRKLINLREKKATELLGSLAYPAAVQAQMTATPPTSLQGLNDQKMKRRILAENDLEARRGHDFCLWLSQVNNKRQRIAKQRTLRQSKVDLATELGLHNQDNLNEEKDNVAPQAPVSDRKQRKIEKIRAMTSELKSERGGGAKRGGGGRGGSRKLQVSRKDSSRNVGEMTPIGDEDSWLEEEMVLDSLDAFSEDPVAELADLDPIPQQNQQDQSPASPTSFISMSSANNSRSRAKDAFDRLEDESADLSECERDQLAVLDSVRASYDPEFLKETGTVGLKVDISEYYKIHLSSEPIRATEVLFERSLMGNSQAGVGECLSWVLRDSSRYLYQDASKPWVPQLLFLTGGLAKLPGMKERLQIELQQLLPWREDGNPPRVVVAADPSLDAWRGAQLWSKRSSESGFKDFTTRKEYEECGFDYLVEHVISNRFYASLKNLEVNPKFNPGRGRQPGTISKLSMES